MTAPEATFDFVIIGAGPAGEAATYKARELGCVGRRDRSRVVRGQLSAHRMPAIEVAAQRRRSPPREPGHVRVATRVGAPRLHGQPGTERRRAR